MKKIQKPRINSLKFKNFRKRKLILLKVSILIEFFILNLFLNFTSIFIYIRILIFFVYSFTKILNLINLLFLKIIMSDSYDLPLYMPNTFESLISISLQ